MYGKPSCDCDFAWFYYVNDINTSPNIEYHPTLKEAMVYSKNSYGTARCA